ncbi:type IV toxin-antitoxin system AbiEi family antitoxin domain-containing protein [Nocardioides sp. NPDC057764]|uniref:type IV toxin-antitoxin system AbiEi family antitoxin domain-containing protein n=1 Tax=Nocardioides sp. NPDC057764 TaxID=3346243 RepID=UPI00367142F4
MDYRIAMTEIAECQWGLITARQAIGVGATPNTLTRLTAQGALERVSHGVYRIAGAPPSRLDDLRADWLALDPTRLPADRLWGSRDDQSLAVISHRSAAVLHDLGDIAADYHEFTLPVRKQTRRPDVRLHRAPLQSDDWVVVDGLPVTTPLRTINDLAAAHIDGGHLASITRDAVLSLYTDIAPLIRVLAPHAHRYGYPTGDGEALLGRFLQEAGIPVALVRAVELASMHTSA